MIPRPEDYARAARDVDLIAAAVPSLVGYSHEASHVPNQLEVQTTNPTEAELLCTNSHYQTSMIGVAPSLFIVEFPRSVNLEAAVVEYLAIPGVQVVSTIGPGGGVGCQPTQWSYQVGAAGTWRWEITGARQVMLGRCQSFHWTILTTLDGAATVVCYANCDESLAPQQLSANDFQCFLNKFAAGDAYANCDGSTNTPSLTANDFLCFLNRYAAGCL